MRWEYKTVQLKKRVTWRGPEVATLELETELNGLGCDGWELVSMIADNSNLVAVLKRSK